MISKSATTPSGRSQDAPEAFYLRDLLILFGLGFMGTVAWLTPEAWWGGVCRALARPGLPLILDRRARERTIPILRRFLAEQGIRRTPEDVLTELMARVIERNFQTLRSHAPHGWKPWIVLEGGEHIDAALARGNGAILWVSHFGSSCLVPKIALHRAGYAVSHLTQVQHGYSRSRFGLKVLNPIRTSVERRYLKERVSMSFDSPLGALRTLQQRVRANGIVSIIIRELSHHPVEVPFLGVTLPVATGAPDLAHSTGATLLPVFQRNERSGRYAVIVEGPLEIRPDLPRREASRRAAAEYAERLTPYVCRTPGQWLTWYGL